MFTDKGFRAFSLYLYSLFGEFFRTEILQIIPNLNAKEKELSYWSVSEVLFVCLGRWDHWNLASSYFCNRQVLRFLFLHMFALVAQGHPFGAKAA